MGSSVFGGGGGAFERALLHVQDVRAAGTQAGGMTAGLNNLRFLNTVLTNQIAGASLAANVLTLPIGRYDVDATATVNAVNGNKLRLFDITAAAVLFHGLSGFATNAATSVNHIVKISGRFSLAVVSDIRLEHLVAATRNGDAMGVAANLAVDEIYVDLKIWRV